MKKINVLFISVLLFILLGGCSSSAPQTADSAKPASPEASKTDSSDKQVTLRYAMYNTDHGPTYQKILDAFMKENPNIKVELQVIPWGNFWDKLMTEIAGGTAPDVFWGHLTRFQSLMEKGALLDISDYLKKDNVDLSKYNQAILKEYQVSGKTYSLPEQWGALAIYYNKDLLKKAGYDAYPKDLSWNTTDGGTFVQFLQKLTLDKNGKHPNEPGFDPKNIVQYGFNYIDKDQVDPGQFIGFVAENGGQLVKDSKLAYDQKLLDAYQFINDLTFKYYVAPTYTNIRTGGSEAKFVSQQVAVWLNGQWMIKPIKQKASFAWGIDTIPKGPEGAVGTFLGSGDVIYSKTKHPEEAWKLVKFVASKTGQDILGSTGAYFPGYSDSLPSFIDYYKGMGIDVSPFVELAKGKTIAPPVAKNYNEWYQIWVKYTSLMLSGEMDPKTTLDKIKQEGDPAATQ